MSARTLAYQGLVLGPVILLGTIGLGARAFEEQFEFERLDGKGHALILSYAAPVEAATHLSWDTHLAANRERVRQTATAWTQIQSDSSTTGLPPVLGVDDQPYAMKDQILTARLKLLGAIGKCVDEEAAAGNFDQAAKDAALALRVSLITKHTDAVSVSTTSRRQAHLVTRLEQFVAKSSPEVRLLIREELVRIAQGDHASTTKLRSLAARTATALLQKAATGPEAVTVSQSGPQRGAPRLTGSFFTARSKEPATRIMVAWICHRAQLQMTTSLALKLGAKPGELPPSLPANPKPTVVAAQTGNQLLVSRDPSY